MYKVLVHRRVVKFLENMVDEELKTRLKEVIFQLADYPLVLRRLDIEKLEGLERTYRVRIGDYRVIFHVDKKERTIYVTHIGHRKSVYKKGGM